MSGYIPELSPIRPATSPMFPSSVPLSRHFDLGPQYGVSTLSGLSGLASMMPVVGPLLGAGMNIIGTAMQNHQQAQFFDKYMSPSARMAQMRAAGINPNAAAQGISGSSAPQMNAAAPTGAFSSLGEALGNSVNTALTAENIAAQTKNLEVQNKGQELQNRMAEVELGIKPDMLSAELDDLRQSANQRRQAVEESKENVRKAEQEIKNLKAEESYTKTKEGLIEYEKRLDEANTRLANAKAALSKAEKELTEVNKQIQDKENENYITPTEQIEKTAKENAKAAVEETPQGRIAKEYEREMNEALDEIDKRIKQKAAIFGPNHSEVRKLKNERDRIIRRYRNKIRRINKGASVGGTIAGTGLNAGG